MSIHIAYCVNGIYKFISLVSIASILINARFQFDYNFYIISDKITEEDKNRYRLLSNIRRCNFEFIEVNEEDYSNMYTYIGPVAYYRLKMPSYVNEGKVLYLDADTISMTDISQLYFTDISEYLMAAVEDILGEYWTKKVGFDYDKGEIYFNSGVLLMNLDKMRSFDFENKVFECSKNNQYWDQDLLNIVAKDNILSLPIRYNCMPFMNRAKVYENNFYIYYRKRLLEYNEAIENADILHLSHKPWSNPAGGLYSERWFSIKEIIDELILAQQNNEI